MPRHTHPTPPHPKLHHKTPHPLPKKQVQSFQNFFSASKTLNFFSVHPNPPPNHPIPHPQPPQPSQPSPPPRPLPPVLGDSEAAPRLPLRDSTGRSTAAAPCGAGPGRGQRGPPAKPLRGKKKRSSLGKNMEKLELIIFYEKNVGFIKSFREFDPYRSWQIVDLTTWIFCKSSVDFSHQSNQQ